MLGLVFEWGIDNFVFRVLGYDSFGIVFVILFKIRGSICILIINFWKERKDEIFR